MLLESKHQYIILIILLLIRITDLLYFLFQVTSLVLNALLWLFQTQTTQFCIQVVSTRSLGHEQPLTGELVVRSVAFLYSAAIKDEELEYFWSHLHKHTRCTCECRSYKQHPALSPAPQQCQCIKEKEKHTSRPIVLLPRESLCPPSPTLCWGYSP